MDAGKAENLLGSGHFQSINLRVTLFFEFARLNGSITRRILRSRAIRQAIDDRVEVHLAEGDDRKPPGGASVDEGRVHDAVHVGDPSVIRPAHHQIADVDDESSWHAVDEDPLFRTCFHFQAIGCVVDMENGEYASVRMGAGTQFAGQGLVGRARDNG